MRDSVSWGRSNADRPKERNPAMEKYRVTLTADEQNALEKLVSVGRAAARKLTHARILLLADTSHALEYRDDQIVLALGTSLRSVERIRKRFAQFIAICRRSKWSKHLTNSPFLALLAMAGSNAACKISSVCSHAFRSRKFRRN